MKLFLIIIASIVNVLDFGAVGDGKTVNTKAFNDAIEACAQKGQGRVEVPAGTYISGTLHLKSGVTLHLQEGAVLRGSKNLADYDSFRPTEDLSRYESGRGTQNANSAYDTIWTKAFVIVDHCVNAGITGRGIIDGNNVRNPQGEEHMRGPHTIICANSVGLRFDSIQVEHASNYAFLGYDLRKSRFTHVQIRGGWDGIHIRGCNDVLIQNCEFHTGDDAIAGGYWQKMRIDQCEVNSSCNGIRMIQPSVDVQVTRSHFYGPCPYPHITSGDTNADHAINIEPGGWGPAPGHLDKIVLSDLRMENVLSPLSVTLGNENTMGSIRVENIVAKDVNRLALSVKSWGDNRIEKAVVKNVDMEFRGIDDPNLAASIQSKPWNEWPVFPSWGMYFRNVDKVSLSNVKLTYSGKDYRKAIITDNAKSVKQKNIKAQGEN